MRETTDAGSQAGPASFEVERFDWTGPDRLEIAGRWFGVRGLRFMRPTLELRGDRNRRLLALLEHKPWAAEDGDEWIAAFAWDGERDEFSAAELAVAPSVVVELSPPGSADGGSGEIATAVDQRASRATPPAANGSKPSAGARNPAKQPVADAGGVDADTARELRELRAERDAAVRERDAAVAERAAAVAERAAAVSERATAVAERDAAVSERDAAVAERDAAVAERDAAAVERVAAMAERDQIAAARKAAPKERDAAEPAALDAAVRERDAVARERDQAVAERDAALAAAAEARRPPPPPPAPPPQPGAQAPPATAPPATAPPATAPPSPRRRRTVTPTVTGTDWTMRLFVLSAIALLLFILVAVIRGFL